ncbi:MAG TPA: exodeoxyribonuclease VII large subunit, partial [Candidatus Omnitrophota bacterium]|nr:exodeoxyribonuclease VII large subunit [Candidatus Omnitrophota bacterium]
RVPVTVAKASRLALASRGDGLKKTIHLRLQNSRAKIQAYQKLAEMADPKNTLKRGFSITRDGRGKAVKSTAVLKPKQEITTELADGVFIAEVRKVR